MANRRLANLHKNGGLVSHVGYVRTENGSASIAPSSSGERSVRLEDGDYIYIDLYQDNGAAENLESSADGNWICIRRTGN